MGSFSFLLRICDDAQEWGRKNISELYVNSTQKYELCDIDLALNGAPNRCTIKEEIKIQDQEDPSPLIHRFRDQAIVYVTIFRDGQDTTSRDFSFARELDIKVDQITIGLNLIVDKDKASQLSCKITYTSDGSKNNQYGLEFIEGHAQNCTWTIYDRDSKPLASKGTDPMPDPSTWRSCEFTIPLTN